MIPLAIARHQAFERIRRKRLGINQDRTLPATTAAEGHLAHAVQMPLFTFGHGTADRGRLVELLSAAGIAELVDVRSAPGSRRNPDVARVEMARWLPEHGIGYRWERRLGGWRKSPPDSPDSGLRNRSFAGYAAHMRTREFLDAIRELVNKAPDRPTTVLCSESLWWRCHRRMIADFMVLCAQVPVLHLLHDGQVQEHRPTEVARIRDDGLLVYDGDQRPRFAAPLF